jgi:hypothetical protein
LPLDFLEALQHRATMQLTADGANTRNNDKLAWMYWCLPNSVNWHPTSAQIQHANDPSIADSGMLTRQHQVQQNDGRGLVCLTAGLSVGLSVGSNHTTMPRNSNHYKLHRALLKSQRQHKPVVDCRFPRKDGPAANEMGQNRTISTQRRPCIQVLDDFPALRSRTPTSAGMDDVRIVNEDQGKVNLTKRWNFVHINYGVQEKDAEHTNVFFREHLRGIIEDNLKGQCTKGHSW